MQPRVSTYWMCVGFIEMLAKFRVYKVHPRLHPDVKKAIERFAMRMDRLR